MTDWIVLVHNPIDPDVPYDFLWDYCDWVTYGWVTEPCQSDVED